MGRRIKAVHSLSVPRLHYKSHRHLLRNEKVTRTCKCIQQWCYVMQSKKKKISAFLLISIK